MAKSCYTSLMFRLLCCTWCLCTFGVAGESDWTQCGVIGGQEPGRQGQQRSFRGSTVSSAADDRKSNKSQKGSDVEASIESQEGPLNPDVVHGKPAEMCKWRWQVSLREVADEHSRPSHFCGGTLISPKWVLTAAHCMEGINDCTAQKLRVVAGDRNHKKDDDPHEVERRVKRVFVHPDWGVGEEMDEDYALLELEEAVPLGPCIGVACLPPREAEGDTAENRDCHITGWGAKRQGAMNLPPFMQEARVTTMSNAECQRKYDRSSATISPAMLCAQGHSDQGITDSCQGDSGGPLVCEEADHYVLRGVTSWGEGCAKKRFPGVYSRVSHQLDWIEGVMAGKVSPPALLPRPADFNGSMWLVVEGPCKKDKFDCIKSPHYPRKYQNNVGCKIAVNASAAVPIKVERFQTEAVYDKLLIGCEEYSGVLGPDGVTPSADIEWAPDDSQTRRGWKICPTTNSETSLEIYP